MSKQRIYKVTHGSDVKLVRAGVKSQAVRHVADKIISAEVASQDDLVSMLSTGAVVEQANEDQETLPLPGTETLPLTGEPKADETLGTYDGAQASTDALASTDAGSTDAAASTEGKTTPRKRSARQ